jgi:hypothetical protein
MKRDPANHVAQWWMNIALFGSMLIAALPMSLQTDYHDEGWDAKVKDAQAQHRAEIDQEQEAIKRATGNHTCVSFNTGLATVGVIVQSFDMPALWFYVPIDVVFEPGWAKKNLIIRKWCTK